MKAQDWSAKRHLLALSFTMQDELIADLAAAEHDVDELTAAARENEGIIERAKGALARIAEVEREMAQGKLITEDAAATAGRAITRAESAERERKTAIELFQHEQDKLADAERRASELRRALTFAKESTGRTQAWMRKNGIVFKDEGGHWEKVAFSIYTDLVEVAIKAEAALAAGKGEA